MHVSKRAGLVIGMVIVGLLLAFAYGGYRRQQRVEADARDAGIAKGGCAGDDAQAASSFKPFPYRKHRVAQHNKQNQLQPPGTVPPSVVAHRPARRRRGVDTIPERVRCIGSIRKPGSRAMSRPLQERLVVRQPPPAHYSAPPSPPQPDAQRNSAEQRLIQREREAMLAPTGGRAGNSGMAIPSLLVRRYKQKSRGRCIADCGAGGCLTCGADRSWHRSHVAEGFFLDGFSGDDTDYEGQNMQTRKETFLAAARSQKTGDYFGPREALSWDRMR